MKRTIRKPSSAKFYEMLRNKYNNYIKKQENEMEDSTN